MLYPLTYNLTIVRRSTFDVTFQVLVDADNPYDFTSKTLLSQLWDLKREEKYADFTVTTLSPVSSGLIRLGLSSNTTISLPDFGVYDVKVIDNVSGDEYFLIKGGFTVQQGYTDD